MSLSSSIRSIPKLILTLALFGAFFITSSSYAHEDKTDKDADQIKYDGGDIKAGKLAFLQKGCPACHGGSGVAIDDDDPILKGQHKVYLINQLNSFKAGTRTSEDMPKKAASLSNKEIKDIATYLSSLKYTQ